MLYIYEPIYRDPIYIGALNIRALPTGALYIYTYIGALCIEALYLEGLYIDLLDSTLYRVRCAIACLTRRTYLQRLGLSYYEDFAQTLQNPNLLRECTALHQALIGYGPPSFNRDPVPSYIERCIVSLMTFS